MENNKFNTPISPIYTSTPLNSDSLKKRQLIREKMNNSFSSPAHKSSRMRSTFDEDNEIVDDSDETMADLFAFDKKNEDKENAKQRSIGEVDKSGTAGTDMDDKEETDLDDEEEISNELNDEEEDEEESGEEEITKKLTVRSSDEVDTGSVKPINQQRSAIVHAGKTQILSSDEEDGTSEEDQHSIQEDSNASKQEIEIVDESEEKVDESLVIVEDSIVQSSTAASSTKSSQISKATEDKFQDSSKEVEDVLSDSAENSPISNSQSNPPKKDAVPGNRFMLVPLPAQHGRLFGGQMTEERMEKINFVTNDMINAMHRSLSTIPENISTEPPKGLRTELMPHQKHGLTWLLWREQQIPPSGILADDMGLGKTLAMISLILYKKHARKTDREFEEYENRLRRHYIQQNKYNPLVASNGTLVIAPASLIYQWEKEVRDRVKDDQLQVHVFHGPKNKRDISSHRLAKYDIVITTYDLLVSEMKSENLIGQSDSDDDSDDARPGTSSKKNTRKLPKQTNSVLAKIAWDRIILDEAHEIRNRSSLKSQVCCRLEAVHRWCLTGTPIHNKLRDLFSLIRFLRITPFNEEKMWKDFIESSKKGPERLNTIVKSVLLRRTKNQICAETNKPIVDLQPRKHEIVKLDLQGWEKHCYGIMFEASKQKVKEMLRETDFDFRRRRKGAEQVRNPFIGGGGRIDADDNFKVYSCILVLLLRLRQACVHMSLTKNAVDIDAFKDDDANDEQKMAAEAVADNMLEMSFAQMSLDEDGLEQGMVNTNKEIEKIFEREYASTKIAAILQRLKFIIETGDKCVIVSQWTSMLGIIEYHLKQSGVKYTSITGEVKTDDRQHRVDSFNKSGTGPSVMLLSLTAGGVGLNLIGGNHLFMVDLHWNPALEQQACDRIYRLGQKKSVFIHKFICNETLEQRVLEIQDRKSKMATGVMEGAASKRLTKLSKDELVYLFELDKRPQVPRVPAIQQPANAQAVSKSAFPSTSTMRDYN